MVIEVVLATVGVSGLHDCKVALPFRTSIVPPLFLTSAVISPAAVSTAITPVPALKLQVTAAEAAAGTAKQAIAATPAMNEILRVEAILGWAPQYVLSRRKTTQLGCPFVHLA
jgi:hypothetical protein